MKKSLSELDMYKANLTIAMGLVLLYIFAYPNRYLLYVGTAVGVVTVVWPALAQWISRGWYKLAEGLGYVNSRILLTLVFFVLLLPIALLYRLFSHNVLALHSGRTAKSLYKERNHQYVASNLKNVW